MIRKRTLILVACVSISALGCHSSEMVDTHEDNRITVTGQLVAVKDDRPADGGVDLTVETENGAHEILRVGSAFIAGDREPVLALQRVVDAAKIGDRLKASGRRDASGALLVERLEIVD